MDAKKIMAMVLTMMMAVPIVSSGGGDTVFKLGVIVGATCGLTVDPSLVDFGSMSPGDTSVQDINFTSVTNSGNTATQVLINGSGWTDGGVNNFVANATHWYNATGSDYDAKKWLNITQQVANNSVTGTKSFTVFFDLNIPAGQAAATYNQTVWVTSSC